MSEHQNVRIEITDGASIPDPKERRLITAWSLSFLAAIGTLIYLCASQPDPYWRLLQFLPDGILVTFQVTVFSIICSIPIGLITGLGRLSRNRGINLVASTYVEVVRGIPLLVQLFYIYYALGRFLKVPDMLAAIIALSVCYGAYMGEVFRAGIEAIPKGQTEAARSLGFNRVETMFLVVLPQAWRTILPPCRQRIHRHAERHIPCLHHRRRRHLAPWPRIRLRELPVFRNLHHDRARVSAHHPASFQGRQHHGSETELL